MLRLIVSLCLVYTCSAGVIKKSSPSSIWSLTHDLDKTELTKLPELSFVPDMTNMVDQEVEAGSELELTCEVNGIPTPIIYWQLNGKIVEGNYETTVHEKLRNVNKPTIQNGITTSRLRIPCVDKHHRGKYKCIATTGEQTIEKSASISVVGTSSCQATPIAPYIQMWSDSRFENEGNFVQLICRSQKDAVIAWYNEDRELLNDRPGYEVLPNGDLLIKDVLFDKHTGLYNCVASNDIGEARTEVFLYVTGLPDVSSPTLL